MEQRPVSMYLTDARSGERIPIRACNGCAALISSHQEFCVRCLFEGEPQERAKQRFSAFTALAMQLFIHFPIMTALRVGLYLYLSIPAWLWVTYVAETAAWLFLWFYSTIATSRNEKRLQEAQARQEQAATEAAAERARARAEYAASMERIERERGARWN